MFPSVLKPRGTRASDGLRGEHRPADVGRHLTAGPRRASQEPPAWIYRQTVVRRLHVSVSILVGLIVAVAGCGAEDSSGAGAGPPDGLLVGRSFNATGASQDGRERRLVARAGIQFQAEGRTLVATGCNSASGMARMRSGRLVADGFSITAMGCASPGAMEQETFVMSVVEDKPEALLDGDVLILRTNVAEIRFVDRKVADPDRPLEGTRWKVTGQFDPQVASSSAALAGEVVLSSGRVRFTGTCQDAEGPMAVTGATVTVGALSQSPPRPCSQQQQEAEAAVLRLLTGTMKAEITAANLTLSHPDGTGLTLVEAR